MRTGREDVILLLFVHGWKHDARSDDPNLSSFRVVLAQTAAYERSSAAAAGGAPRPVMGIFVGWRGLTAYGPGDIVADTAFWGRQAAGHRVAVGSVRELFGRLRHYRNSRLKNGGAPLLVIAGHSFGGMIVYSALAQSLIESASAPVETVIAALPTWSCSQIRPSRGRATCRFTTWSPARRSRGARTCNCRSSSVFRRPTTSRSGRSFRSATSRTGLRKQRSAGSRSAA
ncbi:hypothetical protein QP162_01700 [Sphingomonas aurantiaca]|uniref:hypothetical protein n=1 Tax=Sphingomonas aurantiaca TaxID=185949 RepID=UPI002FDF1864